MRFTDGRPDRKLYRAFSIRSLDGKIDDFESIREAVARRYTRVVNEELERPDLILIDGGKGQLSAARGVLQGLGRRQFPWSAWPRSRRRSSSPAFGPAGAGRGVPEPAHPGGGAQRVHRFATKLNKKRRTRRLSMQVLEGVPGIGGRAAAG